MSRLEPAAGPDPRGPGPRGPDPRGPGPHGPDPRGPDPLRPGPHGLEPELDRLESGDELEPAGVVAPAPASEEAFEELPVDAPRVGIVMSAKSDLPTMEQAERELNERGIRSELRVMSAHHDPDVVADYARNARMRGLRVIIAGAGLGAALPGIVAAHTELPVIGVPLSASSSVAGGLDALLAIAQMPPGVPVATVGVDAARNAAVLAARILDI